MKLSGFEVGGDAGSEIFDDDGGDGGWRNCS
jgi:hypothetical protein